MSRPLVLLAEDDELFAQQLAQFFAAEGWDSEIVGDGLAALGRLRQEPIPRLVCLDLVLPGLDGWRFYGEVRRNTHFPPVPIVVLSAARTVPDEELNGIIAFVRKPTRPTDGDGTERFESELRALLNRVL